MQNENIHRLLSAARNVNRVDAANWTCYCPVHEADGETHTNSCSVSAGDDGKILVNCFNGCDPKQIIYAFGLTWGDCFPPKQQAGSKITATYDYIDADGVLRFQVCRIEPGKDGRAKDFRQRQPDGNGGWTWKTKGLQKFIYRLRELAAADPNKPVFVVEGEKQVDYLRSLDLIATCNPGGAGRWLKGYAKYLDGRNVIIVPDCDPPNPTTGKIVGAEHARDVADSLIGVAKSIHVVELPGCEPKWGLDDWLQKGGHTLQELREILRATPEWGPESTIVTAAPEEGETADEESGLPEIEVLYNEAETNDAVIAELVKSPNIYVFHGGLVDLIDGLDGRQPRILDAASLRERISQCVQFIEIRETEDGETKRKVRAPGWCVNAILARGEWPFAELHGVVRAPFLRADGTVVQTPGYDWESGYYFDPSGECDPIPEQPTSADVDRAAALLTELVGDFPFASPSHQAAWVAAVLTPLARTAYDGPTGPLFLIDANTRGAGKSLLADLVSIIATGRTAHRMTAPRDDEECRKRITALVAQGACGPVLIDNIAGPLGCASLDAALTGETWSDRLLGSSSTVSGRLAITWLATGNNVQLVADTARRVCHVRLSSDLEHPEDRTGFRYPDILQHARDNRGQYLAAALTILRGWFAAGKPDQGLPSWGSFEGWTRIVRNAVVYAGLPDPGETRQLIRDADDSANSLLQLLTALSTIDPNGRGLSAGELLSIAKGQGGTYLPEESAQLRAALESITSEQLEKLNTKRIGKALSRYLERVCGGMRLRHRLSRGAKLWHADGGCGGYGGCGGDVLAGAESQEIF